MKHPCITWWPEKFLASTSDMTPDGAAYYRLLLDHAWMRGGSLPNDDNRLRLMTRLSIYRWKGLRAEILAKFTLGEDGRWHHPRLDLELERADRRHKNLKGSEGEATKVFAQTNGQKPSKNNDATPSPARAPARDPTPTPTREGSLRKLREPFSGAAQSLSEPPASLSVPHATRAAPDTPATAEDPAMPPEDMDPATADRIHAGLKALAAELEAKNRAAFERPKLEGDPTIQGATSEERERAAALKRLEEMHKAMNTRPLPRIGQRS